MIKFRINPTDVETINKVAEVVRLQSLFNIAYEMSESEREMYLKKVDKEVTACLDDFEKHMQNSFKSNGTKYSQMLQGYSFIKRNKFCII